MRIAQHNSDDAAQKQVLEWYVHTAERAERRRELLTRRAPREIPVIE